MRLDVFETSREILPQKFNEKLGPKGTIAKACGERKSKAPKKAEKMRIFYGGT
jgi:hypothetical protein